MEHDEFLEGRVTSDGFDAAGASVRSIHGVERLGSLFDLEVVLVWQSNGDPQGPSRLGELPRLDAIAGAAVTIHFELRKVKGTAIERGGAASTLAAIAGASAKRSGVAAGGAPAPLGPRGRTARALGPSRSRSATGTARSAAHPPAPPGMRRLTVFRGGAEDGTTLVRDEQVFAGAPAGRPAAPAGARYVTVVRGGKTEEVTLARDDHQNEASAVPAGMRRVRLLRRKPGGIEPSGGLTFIPEDHGTPIDGALDDLEPVAPAGMRRVPLFRGGKIDGSTFVTDDGARPIELVADEEDPGAPPGKRRLPLFRGGRVDGFTLVDAVTAGLEDDADDADDTSDAVVDDGDPPTPRGMRRVPIFRGGKVDGFTFVPIALGAAAPELQDEAAREAAAELRRAVEGVELVRTVHGLVTEASERVDAANGDLVVTLRVRSRAHNLALVDTNQVFLETSLPDILRAKLHASGFEAEGTDYVMRLQRDYAPIDFVAQYRESDLAFVKRLCEHHGLTVWVEHDGERDCLVFSDHNGAFPKSKNPEVLEVNRARGMWVGAIRELRATKKLIPSMYVEMDYNYRAPQLDLTSQHELADAYGGGVVEYGAHYRDTEQGALIAQIRGEERRAGQLVYEGLCSHPGLVPGKTIRVHDAERWGDLELLVTEVRHDLQQVSSLHDVGRSNYDCRFVAIPGDRTYRAPRETPRPRIHGVLHAIIDPLPNDEIGEFSNLDEMGRYTVRMYFDVAGSTRTISSKRVRMIQNLAGGYYGTHWPLKPGIEVMIAFVDGDPDRPVIVGAVPNPVTSSPVTSENATMSRTKTVSGILIEMKDRG